jgi:hypothetical protein
VPAGGKDSLFAGQMVEASPPTDSKGETEPSFEATMMMMDG